jgi:uncharacterized membrane-anchored protein
MSERLRQVVLIAVACLVLGMLNVMIYQKEQTLQNGKVILLELAPVDPRSLMQGDYMVLRYKLAREVRADSLPLDGHLIVALNDQGVATYRRPYTSNMALAPDEHLLRYRKRGDNIRLGAESFFFQEGNAKYYSGARYGELRVAESGDSVLSGLRGKELEKLGPDTGMGKQ